MKIKRGEREVWWAGRKEDGNCRRTLKIQKSDCFEKENLGPFIASIYM